VKFRTTDEARQFAAIQASGTLWIRVRREVPQPVRLTVGPDTESAKTSTERTTVRATIDGVLLADADGEHIISIEGSRYFPPDSLTIGTLKDSPTPYVCPWKGQARYYSVETPHHEHIDAAWCYPHPKRSAIETVGHDFTGYVAFDTTRVTIE